MPNQLQLYTRPFCGFCSRVKRFIEKSGIELQERNIWAEAGAAEELMAGGGRSTVPCLRIENASGSVRWMYESSDIIEYLKGVQS